MGIYRIICYNIMNYDEFYIKRNICQIYIKMFLKYKEYLLIMWNNNEFFSFEKIEEIIKKLN